MTGRGDGTTQPTSRECDHGYPPANPDGSCPSCGKQRRSTLTVMAAHVAADCPDRDRCWARDIHDEHHPRVPAPVGGDGEAREGVLRAEQAMLAMRVVREHEPRRMGCACGATFGDDIDRRNHLVNRAIDAAAGLAPVNVEAQADRAARTRDIQRSHEIAWDQGYEAARNGEQRRNPYRAAVPPAVEAGMATYGGVAGDVEGDTQALRFS